MKSMGAHAPKSCCMMNYLLELFLLNHAKSFVRYTTLYVHVYHKWIFLPILFCQTLWKKQILCGKYFHSLEEQCMGWGFCEKNSFLCPDQPASTIIDHNYYSELNSMTQEDGISLPIKKPHLIWMSGLPLTVQKREISTLRVK